jgi:hypothetical protein
MALYLESPDGPLANQIIYGVPLLADNWGFGVDELGRAYFDTGVASPGQRAYIEITASGRLVMVAPRRPFGLGGEFVGKPLRENPPQHAVSAGFVGTPMPAGLPGWGERQRRPAGRRSRPASGPPWSARPRLPRRPGMLPENPPQCAPSRDFTGRPVAPMPASRSLARGFTGRPMPATPPNRASNAGFVGQPMPPNPASHAPNAAFAGRPMPPNPRGRSGMEASDG